MHSVTVSITGTNKAGCSAADFTLSNPTMLVDREVPAGAGVDSWSGATIAFNDKADTNQDACKGATVNLGYSSN